MKFLFTLFLLCLCTICSVQGQLYKLQGTVLGAGDRLPIASASIQVDQQPTYARTDSSGRFELSVSEPVVHLTVTSLGYTSRKVQVSLPTDSLVTLLLEPNSQEIQEVLVSTGYEEIPRDRATGSYEVISNEMLNRSTSPDILGRIENMATGLHFDKTGTSSLSAGQRTGHDIYIHGISTLREGELGRNFPLIILDNFPYEGDLSSINPNEIESITILKDAAAASIWGSKAGNGVIVLKSKKGNYNQRINVNFNSTLTLMQKPNLYKHQIVSPSDYIDIERELFEKGFYTVKENDRTRPALSPIVELLIDHRENRLSDGQLADRIDMYRAQDVRTDVLRHLYRSPSHQQYALNLSGGSSNYRFILSAGHDRNTALRRGMDDERFTLRMENVFKLSDRMELSGGVRWSASNSQSTPEVLYTESGYAYPYMRLVDADGQALPVPKDYRMNYLDTVGRGQLLDWHYRPVYEVNNPSSASLSTDFRANFGFNYSLFPWLKGDLKYQYTAMGSNTDVHRTMQHYATRNLVNRGTELRNGVPFYHFPYGSTLQKSSSIGKMHNIRGQLNVDKSWGTVHRLNAIGGVELSERVTQGHGSYSIGYDENTLSYATALNYSTRYPIFDNLGSPAFLPNPLLALTSHNQRFISTFANSSYSLFGKYTVNASARRDASNLFGVATNNKWSPLWSSGVMWDIGKESFYHVEGLPNLKVRFTFGYSGNVDNSMVAVPTLVYSTSNSNLPYPRAGLLNAPNAELRWEKVQNTNIGIDFGSKNNRISGTIDLYRKRTTDLYEEVPVDPTFGLGSITMNAANTKSLGIDARIRTLNLTGKLQWSTNWLFSYNNNWITKNYREYTGPQSVITNGLALMEGEIAFPMYSYKWAGLDPTTGQPRGMLEGEPSADYFKLTSNSVQLDHLIYHGSSRPLYFGAMLHSFSYKNLSLSANISWKFDYYFRRQSINYTNLLNLGYAHRDYADRWQLAGDEARTDVPAFIYPLNGQADVFYGNSEVLVERGDYIRLEDIRIDYRPANNILFNKYQIQFFGLISNMGFLWRANKLGINPDNASTIPLAKSFTVGLTVKFN